ncbi:MAG: hypothetical protein ABSF70_02105 [Terracidiphilus sp.]|jgi:predicted DNA-binding mobile mystery protein A
MRNEFRSPQFTQLAGTLASFRAAYSVRRPPKGWIHAARLAAGISSGELGRILGVSRQLPLQFEKAEADDSITLKSLRKVGDALDCDLVYALVPRAGPAERPVKNRAQVQLHIEAAAETLASEDQAENSYFCD